MSVLPALDLALLTVGPLRLGDPPERARLLGAPKRSSGSKGNEVHEYEGFELEFSGGGLVCVSFDLDEKASVPVGDWRLSRATKPVDVQVWLGEPSSDSTGGQGLRWIDYDRGGATLALEFDAKGLTCVQLYREGYA